MIRADEIVKLLESALSDLSDLTVENFDYKLALAKSKIEKIKREKLKNPEKFKEFQSSKKIMDLTKLISEKFDNILAEWKKKVYLIQKEIEISQNQKKISIYKR